MSNFTTHYTPSKGTFQSIMTKLFTGVASRNYFCSTVARPKTAATWHDHPCRSCLETRAGWRTLKHTRLKNSNFFFSKQLAGDSHERSGEMPKTGSRAPRPSAIGKRGKTGGLLRWLFASYILLHPIDRAIVGFRAKTCLLCLNSIQQTTLICWSEQPKKQKRKQAPSPHRIPILLLQ